MKVSTSSHVNKKGEIRFGLGAVKGVGEIKQFIFIVKERKKMEVILH